MSRGVCRRPMSKPHAVAEVADVADVAEVEERAGVEDTCETACQATRCRRSGAPLA